MDQRMNYESMKSMSDSFKKASQQLQEMQKVMENIANMMEQGALQGTGGDMFRSAIKEKLTPKLKEFDSTMTDMSKNIDGAVEKIRDGVSTAQSRFA
ncbi:MAG: WXG100 family type VII secretion target [Chloroflexi bacterium]|nr:WXG100 family type VII secretion target [Chloroflexota bacterium]MCL5275576.1 WXG100 family type VII secretion target [Chloroflexota bacterium]